MKITDFIKNKFVAKLKERQILVIYDPQKIYKEIVDSLNNLEITLVDGSKSTILSRFAAMSALQGLSDDGSSERQMVIYLPIQAPINDEEKMLDPYTIFSAAGSVFPESNIESYQSLCKQAKPEYINEIDSLFQNNNIPSFTQIDALATGAKYPLLQSTLKVEGATEIIVSFLTPTPLQLEPLQTTNSWENEWKLFCQTTLGLSSSVTNGYANWHKLLSQFILFSEFAMDLPGTLPEALLNIPKALPTYENIIYNICERLRTDILKQDRYIELAEKVSQTLNLNYHFKESMDLGKRDTFSFEEKRFLTLFNQSIQAGQFQRAKEIYTDRTSSIWVNNFPERKCLWNIALRCLNLTTLIKDILDGNKIPTTKVDNFINFYSLEFYKVDSEYRLLEKDFASSQLSQTEQIENIISSVRKQYKSILKKLQANFLLAVKNDGWPSESTLRHTKIFNTYVERALKDKKRVVYFMVDAMRYELATHIYQDFKAVRSKEIIPVCAQLPTSTTIGMAALLPNVDGKLSLSVTDNGYDLLIDGVKCNKKAERETYLANIFGDRVAFWDLNDLKNTENTQLKKKIKDDIDLLIVHTQDIDALGESNPETAKFAITEYNQSIIRALHKVTELKFNTAILSADHGFMLLHETDIGDSVSTPAGNWGYKKRRCLIGNGQTSSDVITFDPEFIGLKTNAKDYTVPNGFSTFQSGTVFFHEGLSLQECLIPVIKFDLQSLPKSKDTAPKIGLNYRLNTTNKVTTHTPSIEVCAYTDHLLSENISFSVAAFSNNELIGEIVPASNVDPSSKIISIPPNKPIKLGLLLKEDFTGTFEVRAFDPVTDIIYFKLELQTDFLE